MVQLEKASGPDPNQIIYGCGKLIRITPPNPLFSGCIFSLSECLCQSGDFAYRPEDVFNNFFSTTSGMIDAFQMDHSSFRRVPKVPTTIGNMALNHFRQRPAVINKNTISEFASFVFVA